MEADNADPATGSTIDIGNDLAAITAVDSGQPHPLDEHCGGQNGEFGEEFRQLHKTLVLAIINHCIHRLEDQLRSKSVEKPEFVDWVERAIIALRTAAGE